MSDAELLAGAIEDLRAFADTLLDAIEQARLEGTVPAADAVALLMDLRDVKRVLGEAFHHLNWLAHDAMITEGHYGMQVEGLGWFERTPGGTYHWRDQDVLGELVAKARDPDVRLQGEGGEIERPEEALARLILAAGNIGYWRKGALEALGAYREEFRWKEKGRPGVKLPPRQT